LFLPVNAPKRANTKARKRTAVVPMSAGLSRSVATLMTKPMSANTAAINTKFLLFTIYRRPGPEACIYGLPLWSATIWSREDSETSCVIQGEGASIESASRRRYTFS